MARDSTTCLTRRDLVRASLEADTALIGPEIAWLDITRGCRCRRCDRRPAGPPMPLERLADLVEGLHEAGVRKVVLGWRHDPWEHPALDQIVTLLADRLCPPNVVNLATIQYPKVTGEELIDTSEEYKVEVVVVTHRVESREGFMDYLEGNFTLDSYYGEGGYWELWARQL